MWGHCGSDLLIDELRRLEADRFAPLAVSSLGVHVVDERYTAPQGEGSDIESAALVMAVNATGTYLVTKAFLPAMLESGWGRIVNMSSVSAQRGGGVFGKVPYSSAKAAILGFTKALAREIAETGITVNAVTPDAVDTNIRVGSTDEQEAKLAQDIPIGRTATTEEVAAVIVFLSSEDASYLTGTTADINGGSHIH